MSNGTGRARSPPRPHGSEQAAPLSWQRPLVLPVFIRIGGRALPSCPARRGGTSGQQRPPYCGRAGAGAGDGQRRSGTGPAGR